MNGNQFLCEMEQFDYLLRCVVAGIESHLESCEADPEYIIGTLSQLSDTFSGIIKETKKSALQTDGMGNPLQKCRGFFLR